MPSRPGGDCLGGGAVIERIVESEDRSLFGDLGKWAIGWRTRARRVLGLLGTIVVV